MSLLRRSAPAAQRQTSTAPRRTDDEGLALLDWAALRDEPDSDPLIEEAAERLRAALASLDARDEWGRPIAWRQVARIALGPVLTQLRDSQTATRLLDATRPAGPAAPPAQDKVELPDGADPVTEPAIEAESTAVSHLPTPAEMPFWPA